jgi:SAM-dependent methyltransferase
MDRRRATQVGWIAHAMWRRLARVQPQDRAGQDRMGQDRAGQDRAGQDGAGHDPVGKDRAGALADARRVIKADWADSPYYAQSEIANDPVFWGPHFPFLAMFEQLDLSRVIELACGHGRHSARFADRAGQITLVDINEPNIAACRARFAGRDNVSFLVCSGSDLMPLTSGGYTAVFCYDAMVHFELHDIIAYLEEIQRVLVPGGRALLHYSNYTGNPGGSYHDNPHWRNFNSEPLFRHLAMRSGFTVCSSHLLDWADSTGLDAVTLIEKVRP